MIKKKHILSFLLSGLLVSAFVPIVKNELEVLATPGTIGITINSAELRTYKDGLNRLSLILGNKENQIIDNAALRDSNTSLTPTICFNGVDYTIGNVTQGGATLNGYVSMMCQDIPNPPDSLWRIYFKHDAGQGASGNASWYPSDYPGLPEGKETTIKFYADTIFGQYKILNDFTIRINAVGDHLDFICNPHKVNANNCSLTNTYLYNNYVCASCDSLVYFKPNQITGKTISSIEVKDSDNEIINYTETENIGTYQFVMPDKDVTINVNYESVSYLLTLGDSQIKVVPGEKIGNLPDGRWMIDGYPICSESIYVWNENKTASKVVAPRYQTYRCECFVDGTLFETIEFTDLDSSIVLPAIPYKEGYKIIGWDLKGIEYKNLLTNAIYEKL